MIEVSLSEPEHRIARYIGMLRNKYTERNLKSNPIPNPKDPAGPHILGHAGELVVAKVLNLYPDLTPIKNPKSKDDLPKPDLIFDGYGIDVKAVSGFDMPLLIPMNRWHDEMLYVLVAGLYPHYRIIGDIEGAYVDWFGVWAPSKYPRKNNFVLQHKQLRQWYEPFPRTLTAPYLLDPQYRVYGENRLSRIS
jgi:hypothetical protein